MTPETSARTSGVVLGLLTTVGAAIVWAGLAAWRPTVTLHLAPVIVAASGVYALWSRPEPIAPGAVQLTALLGGGSTAATALLLDELGWLAGPTWVGRDALTEALWFTAGTTALLFVVSVVTRGGRGTSHPPR